VKTVIRERLKQMLALEEYEYGPIAVAKKIL
jgi:hypothetical protein